MSSFVDLLKRTKQNVITAVFVEEETSKARLDICNSCEFLTKTISRCEKCGCFMIAKTKLKNARCPIKKW